MHLTNDSIRQNETGGDIHYYKMDYGLNDSKRKRMRLALQITLKLFQRINNYTCFTLISSNRNCARGGLGEYIV